MPKKAGYEMGQSTEARIAKQAKYQARRAKHRADATKMPAGRAPTSWGGSGRPARPSPVLDEATKTRISNAVHAAVQEISGDTGAQMCHLYAIAGCGLLNVLYGLPQVGPDYIPQAGSLWLCPNPDDPGLCFNMNAENGGYMRGEIHCWIANRVTGNIIDFSARHFSELCAGNDTMTRVQLAGEPDADLTWRRAEVEYVWTTGPQLPEYYKIMPERHATEWLYRGLTELDGMKLIKSAARHYFQS